MLVLICLNCLFADTHDPGSIPVLVVFSLALLLFQKPLQRERTWLGFQGTVSV